MVPAVDHGFAVQRRYQALREPSDVRQRDDGAWEIRAAATVEVIVSMSTPIARYHVALSDPLPAGLEALNPKISTNASGWPRRLSSWFEHEYLRDDRAQAFVGELGSGKHEYRYLARATTVGDFIVPPSRAETMYEAEVYGHSASDQVVVVGGD